MIESELLQYGILGLWTITLLAKDFKFNKEIKRAVVDLKQMISNNTIAFTKLSSRIELIKP